MIQGIQPTSKASLKLQCLFAARGDVDEARELYGFLAEDIPSLPDFDPTPTTWVDSTKDVANGIVSWIGANKETLVQAYEFVRGMTGNRLPPLSLGFGEPQAPAAGAAASEALPPINE